MAKLNPQIYKKAYKWQFEAYPFYTSVYNMAAARTRKKYFTSFNQLLNYFHNGQLYIFVPRTRINKTGNMIIKELIAGNDDFLTSFKKVHFKMKRAIKFCMEARKKGEYADLQIWWVPTQDALSDVTGILFNFDFTLDGFLLNMQKKSEREFNELKNLIYTDKPSFIDEAKSELIRLNKKYPENFNKIHREFKSKFGWFQNSYKGRFEIDKKWLRNYLNAIKADKYKKIEKKSAKPPKKFNLLAKAIKLGITFRDDKKKLLLIAVDLMELWLKDICKKNNWKYEEMRWLSMDEVFAALVGKRKSHYLEKARDCVLKNFRYGMMTSVGYDDIAPGFWRKVYNLNNAEGKVGEIKGIPANKGICRGVARVILNSQKAAHLKDGDILVTSMTRPEFFVLMKKAAAFVTDEGGITCHAAIVSREMGKPCIIGTKIATKVLRDGDLVEVDAEKGVIKLINKAK